MRAIRWSPGNYTPHAAAAASATYGAVPLTVEFGAGGSTDPDGDALTYAWDFGDGASATGPDAEHVYTTEGLFPVRLTVTDAHGAGAVADLLIGPGNSPPELDLTAPADGATYRVGETVALAATATDAQDGNCPRPASRGTSCCATASIRTPDPAHGTCRASRRSLARRRLDYEVTVTAVDTGGLRRAGRPFTRASPGVRSPSPPGAALAWDGRYVTAPASFGEAVGYRPMVSAPATLARAGATYRFAGWSDGGARLHAVAIPPPGTGSRRATSRRSRPRRDH